jgi:signal transduction histidine kinase/ActR/RegA family two-component response regulator
MLTLLLGLPLRLWALLGLIVLVPMGIWLVGITLARRWRLDLATRLASRGAVIIGLGFGALAVIAVLFVLSTGLQEIRRRHLPAVVELAAVLGPGHARAPDSVSVQQELALFRAREPDAGPAVAWDARCMDACLTVSAEGDSAEMLRWSSRLLARPIEGGLRTVTLGGELHLAIPSALRDQQGAPIGHLLVTVRAGWVADRALQTALALVVLGYVLLLSVWWILRRAIAGAVAIRAQAIAARLQSTNVDTIRLETPSGDGRDALSVLDRGVRRHISETVTRLREADRRTAEARAVASRMEATATLAAGVAHDFNNLMTGVMANSELLKRDLARDPEALQTLGTIIECADRGGRLAQQLLAFARGGKYQPAVVDFNIIIRETLRVEAHTVAAGIEIRTELAADLRPVEADPTQLSQVVSNLHRNAVEALGGKGTIAITTRNVPPDDQPAALKDLPPGGYVAFAVTDSGPGMTEDTRARIFEPFFTTKAGGRGMGLAATYGIVAHHGGQIDVQTSPGGGTVFTVYLPVATRGRPAAPAPAPQPASRVSVLFVDDEVAILSATRRLLEASGYQVFTADNGHDAIRIARTARQGIDIILLDLRMPGLSGVEAFEPLAQAQPEARIILCSGYELDGAARALLEQGAAEFVRKPFRLEDLTSAIARALAARGNRTGG